MIKRELAIRIARRTGTENHVAEKFVDALVEEVRQEVNAGGQVHLRGFGSFYTKKHGPKVGRLLKGPGGKGVPAEPVIIPARTVVKFKVSDRFANTTE